MAATFVGVKRPIILGIVGDSAAGKTTLSRGITQILGSDQLTGTAVRGNWLPGGVALGPEAKLSGNRRSNRSEGRF